MALLFAEPGGDATFNLATNVNGGFYGVVTAGATVVSDFVHGNHSRSLKFAPNTTSQIKGSGVSLSDAGTRMSIYFYFVALPTSLAEIYHTEFVTPATSLKLTSAGVLQLWNGVANQIGGDGPTLSTGKWYRISLAYTIASSSVNRFEVFVDSKPVISATNTTTTTANTNFCIGNSSTDTTLDFRVSDIYIDNSSSLVDTGDVWVTAKRPFSNGTTNGFTTQIGSGGSGYGSGHAPQVNERVASTTNGWSMVGAGAAITEQYNIENKATGDFDISSKSVIDYMGWVYTSSLVGETINIIINGVNFSQAITSTNTLYKKIAGSAGGYPLGAGLDIGIQTDTSLTTVSLFECGVIVAYLNSAPSTGLRRQGFESRIRPRTFSPGLAR